MATAKRLAAEDPNVFIPNQFENRDNLLAHKENTALEILEQIRGPIHGFCSGVGTGGTITGIGQILKEHFPDISIWAAEPENAAILSGGNIGTHLQMGIGDGLIPNIFDKLTLFNWCLPACVRNAENVSASSRYTGVRCATSLP